MFLESGWCMFFFFFFKSHMTIEVLRPPLPHGLTGRSVVVLEVHTKRFYCSLKWKEISSKSLDLTKASCSPASSTSPTPESPYMDTCMEDSPSCVQTQKGLALWHQVPKTEGKYLKRTINKMPSSWERETQGLREQETISAWLRG